MNIVDGPAKVTKLVKQCIQLELDDGILSDVITFVPSYNFDGEIEEPAIGLFEHETTPVVTGTLSRQIELQTPFEFICIVYDDEDIEKAEIKSKELAGKVAAAIARNFQRELDGEIIPMLKPVLNSINPVGTVTVEGKSDLAVATSVRITINYYVDWLICRQRGEGNG